MSTRIITTQQFSDGTTIDGNRIEQAMQQLEKMCDNVPTGNIKTRFTRSQIVLGWNPILDTDVAGYTHEHPWIEGLNNQFLPEINDSNLYRLKGYHKEGLISKYYLWETSFTSSAPLIIDSLDLFLAQDAGGTGGSAYSLPGGASVPYTPPEVSDIGLHITIDAPFIPEDRTQNDMELHRRDFSTNACLIRPLAFTAGSSAGRMRPDYPGGALSGWSISSPDLNIPMAPLSRIRFAIVIPLYSGGTGLADWGSQPWRTSVPSLTLTILEPNRRG
jgi:hypothetical protein